MRLNTRKQRKRFNRLTLQSFRHWSSLLTLGRKVLTTLSSERRVVQEGERMTEFASLNKLCSFTLPGHSFFRGPNSAHPKGAVGREPGLRDRWKEWGTTPEEENKH